ncbi:MAG TPA: hypothetical protein H9856_04175 [Candidatus Limosilactobacillus merdigallinarum]|uniref:Uncharacterized protein n=1 Tax=Candidatus Limosilactobacillus merdigallinarum TaxID=2838652 RepID=A0A9D1VHM0_9LACO|nr:hypothetical protein [Candidatus Limosilactobacillus merdigallinarum]
MPKQGQYAQSKRQSHVKSVRQRGKRQPGRMIADQQFSDFVLARFALTSKKDLSAMTAESDQRFLQELVPRLQKTDGYMAKAVAETLQYCLGRVPWQFFQLLSDSWNTIMHFCQREIPAVPLARRILLKQPVDQEKLDQLIAELLGKQAAAITLVNTQNKNLQQLMAQKLQQQILTDKQINWTIVRQLLQPFNKSLSTAKDAGTQSWIDRLNKL